VGVGAASRRRWRLGQRLPKFRHSRPRERGTSGACRESRPRQSNHECVPPITSDPTRPLRGHRPGRAACLARPSDPLRGEGFGVCSRPRTERRSKGAASPHDPAGAGRTMSASRPSRATHKAASRSPTWASRLSRPSFGPPQGEGFGVPSCPRTAQRSTGDASIPDTSRFAPLARKVGNDGGAGASPLCGSGRE
jgi:hypothetical protein